MSAEFSESEIVRQVAEEHIVLKRLMSQIEEALTGRQTSIEEVAGMIAELGDRLIKHFTLEEEGGYFTDALRLSPQLVSKANDLLAQHPKLGNRVRQITVQIGAIAEPRDWWTETMSRFKAFKAELLRHERGEDSLIQDAYHLDLGAND